MTNQVITTFLDDLLDLLQSLDLGLTEGTNLFEGVEPADELDPVCTVYAEPGPPGASIHNQVRPAIEYPRARVIVRSKDYLEAGLKAEACYNSLWIRGRYINGHNYQSIWPMGRPYAMGGPDTALRHQVGFLVQAQQVI